MSTPRFGAACVVLGEDILIIGGHDGINVLRTCELYSPATYSFRPLPHLMLVTGRSFATAAVIGDDDVYVFGGSDGVSRLASCEHWHRTAGTSKFEPSTAVGASTLLGAYASAAAVTAPEPSIKEVTLGQSRPQSVDVFQSLSAAVVTSEMVDPLDDPSGGFLGPGQSMALGASARDGKPLRIVHKSVFNQIRRQVVDTSTFTAYPTPMLNRRYGAASVTLPSNLVVIIGGHDGKQTLRSCEVFDPATKIFLVLEHSLVIPRCFPAVALINNDRIFVMGGHNGSCRVASCEVADARKLDFKELRISLNRSRSGACGVAVLGTLYVIGGTDGAKFWNDCETFELGSMPLGAILRMVKPAAPAAPPPTGSSRKALQRNISDMNGPVASSSSAADLAGKQPSSSPQPKDPSAVSFGNSIAYTTSGSFAEASSRVLSDTGSGERLDASGSIAKDAEPPGFVPTFPVMLTVQILRGTNLFNRETFGKGDPYVKVLRQGSGEDAGGPQQLLQTPTISGDLNPSFPRAESTLLTRLESSSGSLVFHVYDEESVGGDRFMGEAIASFHSAASFQGSRELELTLKPRENEPDTKIANQTALGSLTVMLESVPVVPALEPSAPLSSATETSGASLRTSSSLPSKFPTVMTIKVIRGLNLFNRETFSKSDTYVKILGPDGQVLLKTPTQAANLNPTFPAAESTLQTFVESGTGTLTFHVYDEESVGGDRFMGEATLSVLQAMVKSGQGDTVLLLGPRENEPDAKVAGETNFGSLTISIEAAAPPSPSKGAGGTSGASLRLSGSSSPSKFPTVLTLKVLRGLNLFNRETFSKSDTYVKILGPDGQELLKTPTMAANLNPIFPAAESTLKTFFETGAGTLTFHVYDEERVGGDRFMGEATLSVLQAMVKSGQGDTVLVLRPRENEPDPKIASETNLGSLTVSIETAAPPSQSSGSGGTSRSGTSSRTGASFRKPPAVRYPLVMTIKVLRGLNLFNRETFSKSDTYVKILGPDGQELLKTPTMAANLNPTFPLAQSTIQTRFDCDGKITFHVFDEESVGGDRFMGEAIVSIEETALKNGQGYLVLTLKPREKEPDPKIACETALGSLTISIETAQLPGGSASLSSGQSSSAPGSSRKAPPLKFPVNLTVKILRGLNLFNRETFSKSDTYVRLVGPEGQELLKTPTMAANLNPTFPVAETTFQCRFDSSRGMLAFHVYDEESVGGDRFMGEALISLSDAAAKRRQGEIAFPLKPRENEPDPKIANQTALGTLFIWFDAEEIKTGGGEGRPTAPGMLTVRVLRAHSLLNRERFSTSDPYCVALAPSGHEILRTPFIETNLEPVWPEEESTGTYRLLDERGLLSFVVYDKETLKDVCMGAAKITVQALLNILPCETALQEAAEDTGGDATSAAPPADGTVEMVLPLGPRPSEPDSFLTKNAGKLGTVAISVSYVADPKQRKVKIAPVDLPGTVSIVILKANGLFNRERTGTSDPYAKLLGPTDDTQQLRTPTIASCVNPVWPSDKSRALFRVKDKKGTIRVQLFDENPISDDFMGETAMSVEELFSRPQGELVLTLRPRPSEPDKGILNAASLGTVTIRFAFVPAGRRGKPNQNPGRLVLKVISCVGLLPMDDFTKTSDPFIAVSVANPAAGADGRQRIYTSKVIGSTLTPEWAGSDAMCDFLVSDLKEEISVEVYDHDTGGSEDFIGKITLTPGRMESTGLVSELLISETFTNDLYRGIITLMWMYEAETFFDRSVAPIDQPPIAKPGTLTMTIEACAGLVARSSGQGTSRVDVVHQARTTVFSTLPGKGLSPSFRRAKSTFSHVFTQLAESLVLMVFDGDVFLGQCTLLPKAMPLVGQATLSLRARPNEPDSEVLLQQTNLGTILLSWKFVVKVVQIIAPMEEVIDEKLLLQQQSLLTSNFFGSARARMQLPRSAASAVVFNSTIYIFGGMASVATNAYDTVELFDTSTSLFISNACIYKMLLQQNEVRGDLEQDWAIGHAQWVHAEAQERSSVDLREECKTVYAELYNSEVVAWYTLVLSLVALIETDDRLYAVEVAERDERDAMFSFGYEAAEYVVCSDEDMGRDYITVEESVARDCRLYKDIQTMAHKQDRKDFRTYVETPERGAVGVEEADAWREMLTQESASFAAYHQKQEDRLLQEQLVKAQAKLIADHQARVALGRDEGEARGVILGEVLVDLDAIDEAMHHDRRVVQRHLAHRQDCIDLLFLEHRGVAEDTLRQAATEYLFLRRELGASEKAAQRHYETRRRDEATTRDEVAKIHREWSSKEYWARTDLGNTQRKAWELLVGESEASMLAAQAAEIHRLTHREVFLKRKREEAVAQIVGHEVEARRVLLAEREEFYYVAVEHERSSRLVGFVSRMVRNFVVRDAKALQEMVLVQQSLANEEELARHDGVLIVEEGNRSDLYVAFNVLQGPIAARDQRASCWNREAAARFDLELDSLDLFQGMYFIRYIRDSEKLRRKEVATACRRCGGDLLLLYRKQHLLLDLETTERARLVAEEYEPTADAWLRYASVVHRWMLFQLADRRALAAEEFAQRVDVWDRQLLEHAVLDEVWVACTERIAAATTTTTPFASLSASVDDAPSAKASVEQLKRSSSAVIVPPLHEKTASSQSGSAVAKDAETTAAVRLNNRDVQAANIDPRQSSWLRLRQLRENSRSMFAATLASQNPGASKPQDSNGSNMDPSPRTQDDRDEVEVYEDDDLFLLRGAASKPDSTDPTQPIHVHENDAQVANTQLHGIITGDAKSPPVPLPGDPGAPSARTGTALRIGVRVAELDAAVRTHRRLVVQLEATELESLQRLILHTLTLQRYNTLRTGSSGSAAAAHQRRLILAHVAEGLRQADRDEQDERYTSIQGPEERQWQWLLQQCAHEGKYITLSAARAAATARHPGGNRGSSTSSGPSQGSSGATGTKRSTSSSSSRRQRDDGATPTPPSPQPLPLRKVMYLPHQLHHRLPLTYLRDLLAEEQAQRMAIEQEEVVGIYECL